MSAFIQVLGPEATRDQIESDITFYEVIIHTLDPEEPDHEETKEQYRTAIRDLEARLNPRPQTPASQINPLAGRGSRTSLSLPSRDTASNTRQYQNASPLQQHTGWQDQQWQFPSTSASSSTTIPNMSKRHRDSLQPPIKRSRKNSETPSGASSTGTPISLESLDQVDRDIEAYRQSRPTPQNVLERIRAEEEKFKLEQADREYAEALSRGTAPSFGQSSMPGQRSTQSYFGSDGRISRPPAMPRPERIQRPQMPSFGTLPQNQNDLGTFVPVKNEFGLEPRYHSGGYNDSYQNNSPAHPSYHPTAPLGSSSRAPISLDDDEDDCEIVQTSSRQLPPLTGHHNQSNAFTFPTLASQNDQSGYVSPPYNEPGFVPWGLGSGAGATYGPSGINAMAGGTSVYGSASSMFRAGASVFNNAVSGLFGGGYNGYSTNPIDLDDDSLYAPPAMTLEQNLQSRGLDYMLNDPAHSREDLESLIQNIRPDEDIPPNMRGDSPKELQVVLMEHQKLGLAWLQKQEASSAKGGILADDMGLGKTIQALALIVTRPSNNPGCKTNLIVAPVALLRQWKREIEQRVHRGHKLSTFIYHGQHKNMTFAKLATYDVVLTTYGKLASEYKKKFKFDSRQRDYPTAQRRPDEQLVLLDSNSQFYRVIVDEAQNIKNHNTKSAMGALYLRATYRLVMTGTPMMNNVGELYSLIRFLRLKPYNNQETFNRTFKKPLDRNNDYERNAAMKHLQGLLKSIMLRRTKESKIDDKPILNLPPRSTEVAHAVFEDDQEHLYRALEMQTQLEMNKFLQKGRKLTNYSYVLVRLLRLRQACDHPHLIQDLSEEAYSDVNPEIMEDLAKKLEPGVIQRIKDANGAFECPICYDAVENPSIFFPCGHDCCPECFVKVTDPTINQEGGHGAKCPECRNPLDTKKIIDYRSFKKVFMPEEIEAKEEDTVKEEEEAEESDSDSDDEDDDDSDADSQGDLRDFIVDDDKVEEAFDNESESETKPSAAALDAASEAEEELEGDDYVRATLARERDKKGKSKKAAKSKSKGKGKAKAKAKKPKEKKKKLTLAELRVAAMRNKDAKKRYLRRLRKNYIPSAKIEKTLEIIDAVVANDPTEKIIIFSQFTSFLDFLEIPIADKNWQYRRYDGAMSANLRNDAVMDFQDPRQNIKVMLVSLKAGNAGLNLTAASQVIILDPFWNPFIEEQAVDRAHRIGQMRPVQVHRMLVENTVEDRIVALQEKKRELITTALDEKAGKSLSRLGVQELRYLFGLDSRPPGVVGGGE